MFYNLISDRENVSFFAYCTIMKKPIAVLNGFKSLYNLYRALLSNRFMDNASPNIKIERLIRFSLLFVYKSSMFLSPRKDITIAGIRYSQQAK